MTDAVLPNDLTAEGLDCRLDAVSSARRQAAEYPIATHTGVPPARRAERRRGVAITRIIGLQTVHLIEVESVICTFK